MKQLYFLIALLAVLCSCSSDNDTTEPSGQYIYQNDTLTVAISFETNNAVVIHAYKQNTIDLQELFSSGYYEGEYPHYTVTISEPNAPLLIMECFKY